MPECRSRSIPAAVFTVFAAAALFLVNVPAAHAQGAPEPVGHWSVTPSFLLGTGGDLNSNGSGFTLAGAYTSKSNLSWEGRFTSLPSVDQGTFVNLSSNVWTLTGNALYYFGQHPWTPYVVGGIGIGHGSADIPPAYQGIVTTSSSTNFVVDFGAGVTRKIVDRINFRGDARYLIGGDVVPSSLQISLGVSFDLGGR